VGVDVLSPGCASGQAKVLKALRVDASTWSKAEIA
jgi:hypothetical protein